MTQPDTREPAELAAHTVYPGGPPCNPYCPGEWSTYHDGYADGYVNDRPDVWSETRLLTIITDAITDILDSPSTYHDAGAIRDRLRLALHASEAASPTPEPAPEDGPWCQYCWADPRYTKVTDDKERRCPVCGADYTGPRRAALAAHLRRPSHDPA